MNSFGLIMLFFVNPVSTAVRLFFSSSICGLFLLQFALWHVSHCKCQRPIFLAQVNKIIVFTEAFRHNTVTYFVYFCCAKENGSKESQSRSTI